MLFYIYSDAPGSTIDITSRCRVGRMSIKDQAEEGAVALSSLIIDDPDGTLEITGHRRMYIYESEAPIFNQVVFNGFVVNERLERGPYRTGAGRQWVVDLADPNVFINRRIMNGADANRPAETDLARIQALLTMTELNTVDDDTYVNTSATTVAMDAVDYRGQNVGAYIDDCRQASGKNGYILYNETVGQYGLWYDFASSLLYDSGKFLSNTIGEPNQSTVFQYSQERTYLNVDPSRVASGIYLEYDGGTVYVQDSGTTAEFAAIDWAAPSPDVKSLTKATARANRYLADAASEDRIVHTVMTAVPRRNVNSVKKGQLIQFKASWMPDYSEYTSFRLLYRTVTEISEDPEASFEIEMDLTPMPPSTDYLLSFLAQRAGTETGSDLWPQGYSGATPVTNWSKLGNGYARAAGDYPFDVAYRSGFDSASEPLTNVWGNLPLNGSSRPTCFSVEIAGATGALVLLDQLSGQFGGYSSDFIGPTVTIPETGWLIGYFSALIRNDTNYFYFIPPVGVTELYQAKAQAVTADAGLSPNSTVVYKAVTAGSTSITLGHTVDHGTDVHEEWGCMMLFIPGTALSVVQQPLTGSSGGSVQWTWGSPP